MNARHVVVRQRAGISNRLDDVDEYLRTFGAIGEGPFAADDVAVAMHAKRPYLMRQLARCPPAKAEQWRHGPGNLN